LALVVIATVWHVERQQYTRKLKQEFLQHARVSSSLDGPRHVLMVAEMLSEVESGELPRTEFSRLLDVHLYTGLSQMYLHSDASKKITVHLETERGYQYRTNLDNPEAIRKQTGRSLALLQIKNSKELNEALKTHKGFYDMFGQDKIFDRELDIRKSYAAFIDECIERHTEMVERIEFSEKIKQNRANQSGDGNSE
jgi:hypothetical protein